MSQIIHVCANNRTYEGVNLPANPGRYTILEHSLCIEIPQFVGVLGGRSESWKSGESEVVHDIGVASSREIRFELGLGRKLL